MADSRSAMGFGLHAQRMRRVRLMSRASGLTGRLRGNDWARLGVGGVLSSRVMRSCSGVLRRAVVRAMRRMRSLRGLERTIRALLLTLFVRMLIARMLAARALMRAGVVIVALAIAGFGCGCGG